MINKKESNLGTHVSRVNRQIRNGQYQYSFVRNNWNRFPLYEMRGIGFGVCNAVVRSGIFRVKVLPLLRLVYALLTTSNFIERLRINKQEPRMRVHKSLAGRQGIDRQVLYSSARVKRQRCIVLSSRKEIKIVRKNMPALYAPRLQQGG